MKADALSLGATLNNVEVDFYTIPIYQRPYTWRNDDYETLWEDLVDAFAEYQQDKIKEIQPDYYFMGPVVFVKNSAKRSFDIIDGQQRTTTFHILLWYLVKRLTDSTEKARLMQILTFLNTEPKLKVSAKDAATFLEIRNSPDPLIGTSRMTEAANFFREKIFTLQNPEEFSTFLREYTQFIVIIADDYRRAWDLFIGLNGKGVPLNPTDLVKAFICGRSDIGEEASQIWEENILPLQNDSTPYLLFLTRFKAKKFVSENALFKEITTHYPGTISTLHISENSRIFFLFWREHIDHIRNHFNDGFNLTADARKSLSMLRDLGRRDFTTLLFQFAEVFGLKSIFDENLLRLLATYQLRMAISRKRSRERKFISWFKDTVFVISSQDPDKEVNIKNAKIDAIKKIADILRSDAPSNDNFETLVRMAAFDSTPGRLILRHIEEGARGNRSIFDFQVEHLMPQTGTSFWYPMADAMGLNGEPDKIAYNGLVNNIGNLFIIDPLTNNQVKNYEFAVKKKFYQDHLKDWSIARETSLKIEWNKADIEARAVQISTWASNFWKI